VPPKPVSILITWDVDPSPRMPMEVKLRSLELANQLCNEFKIQSTFFVTANAEQAGPQSLAPLLAAGHEIGCHGLTHGNEEEYDRMPEAQQIDYIGQASEKLEQLTGRRPVSFRGPRVKISPVTLRLLAEAGYSCDSSICSQRVDFVSSNLVNTGWIRAPRRPYHPHAQDAFKAGDLPIWELPVSALVVPFISASLNILGLGFMKLYFRLLYAEARRTGKPVVYLAHPTEFTFGRQRTFSWHEFSPAYIRTHGFLVRNLLYRMDPDTWLQNTRQFFAYMAGFPDVQFLSTGAYTAQVLGERAH